MSPGVSLMDYSTLITPNGHFTWHDYALLREWNAYAIPMPSEIQSAIFLFRQIEELIRVPLGKPIYVASGARTAAYTAHLRSRGIQAAIGSAHNTWQAVDLRTPAGMTNKEWWVYCDARWPGRMENLKYTPTWVHIDTRQWGQRIRFNP